MLNKLLFSVPKDYYVPLSQPDDIKKPEDNVQPMPDDAKTQRSMYN